MLLGGDIGGTKTLLALATPDEAGRIRPCLEHAYPSRDHATFDALLERFLGEAQAAGHGAPIEAACLGVAGPVQGRQVKVTHLPWRLDADDIARRLGGARVQLVNDFAAAAAGVLDAANLNLETLQPGVPDAGAARVVLGAGTGLGVAALSAIGSEWKIIAGEGGHIGFAPRDEQQARLRAWLAARDARVSNERILSGNGLTDLYRFLLDEGAPPATPDPLQATDAAAAIAQAGLAAPASTCGRALELFCSIYGAVAGDLALLFDARGGVYLAGGIAAKILPALRAGSFEAAFRDKGVHIRLAGNYPVFVVAEPRLGLLGTLQLAAGRGVAEA